MARDAARRAKGRGRQARPKRSATPGRGEGQCERRDSLVRIYGIHAVAAALANPKRALEGLYLTANAARRLGEALAQRSTTFTPVTPGDLDRRLGAGVVHQGALLETRPLPAVALETILERAIANAGAILILDQVTDPHNVGAILRSASAFGAVAVVIPKRGAPPLEGALAKAASGALEHVPVVLVTNLARTLRAIGAAGLLRLGLAGEASRALEDSPLSGPLAIVLGAEDRGLRQLTRAHCDLLCRISTRGAVESLNVSNAAAIALHWFACTRNTPATGAR